MAKALHLLLNLTCLVPTVTNYFITKEPDKLIQFLWGGVNKIKKGRRTNKLRKKDFLSIDWETVIAKDVCL